MIREAKVVRETKETKINLVLKIDGKGESDIQTRIPFFDHMLTLFAKHSFIDLQLVCQGDIEVDAHHTVEDCGLSLGKAFFQALGSKAGISRYGTGFNSKISNQFDSESLRGEFYMPMDECLIRCVIDFGGRPYLVYRGLDEKALAICRPKDDELRQDMSTMFRFGLAKENMVDISCSALDWQRSFSRRLLMRLAAICILSFSTERNLIILWRECLRLLLAR